MHYGEIKNCDIANGEGVRVTLFVSGCTNHCEHCFQPQTWDFDYGQPFTSETEQQLLDLLAPSYIQGLTLLGGEPFEPENQRVLVPFVRRVRETYPQKTVWAFSGFTLEELRTEGSHPRCEATDELLSMLDVLVDGRFVEALKDISLRFRGFSNQRLIDMKKTRSSIRRNHPIMVTMAQRIEALRTEKGLSRPALAAALGLPRLSIEKFETGRQTPSQEQQQKLAGAFGVSLPYLRGETDDPTSMDNWLSGAVPQEDVVLPKAVRKATAAVVAQSGDSSKSDGAVFSALLKSDSFKALVRETVLDVLKSPEGQALLAKAAKK